MNDDTSLGMFKLIQDIRNNMATKTDIKSLKTDIDHIKNVLDGHIGMLETDEIERIAISKQVDRHDDWIQRASTKMNLKYSTNN